MIAADIRATAKGADDDSPYWFAAGIVEEATMDVILAINVSVS